MVRIFPNERSCLRLVTALAVEQWEEWITGGRYLDMEDLEEHCLEEERGVEGVIAHGTIEVRMSLEETTETSGLDPRKNFRRFIHCKE